MWTEDGARLPAESEWNRAVSVEQFIRSLFRIEEQNDYATAAKDLFDEFMDSKLHFNRFIKVDDPGVVNVKYVPTIDVARSCGPLHKGSTRHRRGDSCIQRWRQDDTGPGRE